MEAKHTPGPWSVADLPHGLIVKTESKRKTAYGASRYAAIGGFDRNDPEQLEEAKANARLIAAAPETAAERDRLREQINNARSAIVRLLIVHEWRDDETAEKIASQLIEYGARQDGSNGTEGDAS